MAQQLDKAYATLTEDQSLVPGTYIKQLTNASKSSSGGSDALFWPPRALHSHIYAQLKIKRVFFYEKVFVLVGLYWALLFVFFLEPGPHGVAQVGLVGQNLIPFFS